MLDSFQWNHSWIENDEFAEMLGNPLFFKIVGIESKESFGSSIFHTEESIEGVSPRISGDYHILLTLEH